MSKVVISDVESKPSQRPPPNTAPATVRSYYNAEGPKDRLDQLAQPRKLHKDFRYPKKSGEIAVSRGAKTAVPTDRIRALSLPKKYPAPRWRMDYRGREGRGKKGKIDMERMEILAKPKPYPECKKPRANLVSRAALKAVAGPRLLVMAEPKQQHPDVLIPKSPVWKATKAVLNYVGTDRIQEISMPRQLVIPPWDKPVVRRSLKNYKCSERTEEIAQFKREHPKVLHPNPVPLPITAAVLKFEASPRLAEMSTPIPRMMTAKYRG